MGRSIGRVLKRMKENNNETKNITNYERIRNEPPYEMARLIFELLHKENDLSVALIYRWLNNEVD